MKQYVLLLQTIAVSKHNLIVINLGHRTIFKMRFETFKFNEYVMTVVLIDILI